MSSGVACGVPGSSVMALRIALELGIVSIGPGVCREYHSLGLAKAGYEFGAMAFAYIIVVPWAQHIPSDRPNLRLDRRISYDDGNSRLVLTHRERFHSGGIKISLGFLIIRAVNALRVLQHRLVGLLFSSSNYRCDQDVSGLTW